MTQTQFAERMVDVCAEMFGLPLAPRGCLGPLGVDMPSGFFMRQASRPIQSD